ncbi:MAG: glycosyltransferase [Candidatus Paceibacterota bacterium]
MEIENLLKKYINKTPKISEKDYLFKKYKRIKQELSKDYKILITGSYSRGTSLPPFNDIDLYLIFSDDPSFIEEERPSSLLKKVEEKVPNIRYLIAGGEFLFAKTNHPLKSLKDEYKNNNVEFLGYVSEKKKKELFESCWLYVVPSRIEGYGISVIEANASGTFVIGNNVQGLKESIKHNKTGILVDCTDIEKLSNTIINWLNKEKLKKKENNCKEWAKKHDWNVSAKETENTLINPIG